MCEADAYLIGNNEKKPMLIMESVDKVNSESDGLNIINIFGDQKFLKARICSLSLVEHKIFLEELNQEKEALQNANISS